MRKISKLLLISVPFLAFSGISFGDDSSNLKASNVDSKEFVLLKINTIKKYSKITDDQKQVIKMTYLLKAGDQSAIPVSEQGNKIVFDKHVDSVTEVLNSEGKVVALFAGWDKIKGGPVILNTDELRDNTVHTTLTGDNTAEVTIDVSDDTSNPPASTTEPAAVNPTK